MKLKIINLLTVIFLILLPYYIFEGKMYLGGDDTRLFYSYPLEFFVNVTYFSWYKISSMGINGPSQYLAPFLLIVSLINFIIPSKVALNYLAFSIPLILGFIYFQKAVKELFQVHKENLIELYLGSLFYIFSPILMIEQLFVFLISIWLVGLIPILVYYFLKYLQSGNFKYVFISSIWCIVFSFALYAIPWLAGFLLPVGMALIASTIFFKKKLVLLFLKRSIIFLSFIILTQAFWLTGFVSLYFNLGQDSFASKFLSKGFVDTFTPTILSTATGNIVYPLLNLFHRQIPFDFGWHLKDTFTAFYDRTFYINAIYIIIFAVGILHFRQYLHNVSRKVFIFLLIAFIIALYSFTVNIGPLKDLFILLGGIPGFTMFRNFYDKFAPGYVLIYAAIMSVSLIVVSNKYPKKRKAILIVFFMVTIINFLPVKETVNSPLWTTEDLKKTLNLPREYLEYMEILEENISPSNNILSVPFGSSAYTSIVDEEDSRHVYVGVSPVKIFSGISDISGHYSFGYTAIADVIDKHIIDRNFEKLSDIMYQYNINYILLTKNLPDQLIDSYAYNTDLFLAQDEQFLEELTSSKISESINGNYELYAASKQNSIINSKNVYFKRVSQVKYKIYIKGISEKQKLEFIDSFHAGWKLFLEENPALDFCNNPKDNPVTGSSECQHSNLLFELDDMTYLFRDNIFANSHDLLYEYANLWTIDPEYIKKNFDNNYYQKNADGSIDIEFTLYFVPQTYFYFGTIVSCIVLLTGGIYTLYIHIKYEKKKTKK